MIYAIFLLVLWRIWNARNDNVFHKKYSSALQTTLLLQNGVFVNMSIGY
ncbi:hypothetical protein HanIR_Chr15g0733651 [Helianthus annuus]|nr:hypothetical protein HanIR_Chr15g0733651 [Helianthus annuus]